MFAQAPATYPTFGDTEKRIVALARQHADVMRVTTIGTSAGGRKLHAIELAAKGPVDAAARPAVFVGANIAGFHNAGTEAALKLVERLVAQKALLQNRTFYVLPALNPDAADTMTSRLRWRNALNGAKLDRDRDGLVGEDGPNDLNGDGRITQLRIPDPHGEYMVDPADARLMKKADPVKGEKGTHRLLSEGGDDDGDGQFNEDPAGGFPPDKNFAHGWSDSDPEAGPFASSTPEAKAVMDYLLARRNVAVAFVFGPANNLLELPRGVGSGEIGQARVTVTAGMAGFLGVDARPYGVDELFALLQGSAALAQMGGTREGMASALGAGPATAPDAEDVRYYQSLADEYKKMLEKAGLDAKRPGKQSGGGGLQNWLYYHYSTLAIELDVWGLAKPMEYVDKQAKDAFVAWTPVTLADGTKGEVGGLDPFVEIAPPAADLAKAADAQADLILLAADRLAKVEVLTMEAKELGAGVWRVTATAGNTGLLPTHTKHAVRTRTWLPVRLRLSLPSGAALVSGHNQASSERLMPGSGTLKGEWVVRAPRGARLVVEALSQNAGTDRKELTIR